MKPIAISLVLLSATAAWADGVLCDRTERPLSGQYSVRSHAVRIKVDQLVAVVEVDQVIKNTSGGDLEVSYLFPVPAGAVVSGFEMWIGEKKIEGELLPADKAKQIYYDYVRAKKDPALLEYLGSGLFKTSIFPIARDEERRLRVKYTEVLRKDGGMVRLGYPLSTVKHSKDPLESVTITAEIADRDPVRNVYSPSHPVSVVRSGDAKAKVVWDAKAVKPDTDFVLMWAVDDRDIGLNLLTYRPDPKEPGYFLLFASPKVEIDDKKVEPKDIVFVLDKSGSMQGDKKIQQARDALVFCLRALNDQDRFGIVIFSDKVEKFEDALVGPDQKERAVRYVEQFQANGGTNIRDALVEAMKMLPPEAGRTKMALFLTDGLPTVGVTDVGTIAKDAGGANAARVRLFAFGVGNDVNTTLLDKLARENHGMSDYIKPQENLEARISAYYRKIQSPVLGDVKLEFGGIKARDLQPPVLPDLFRGGQLVVAGRYDGHGPTTLVLSGTAQGKAQIFRYDVAFDEKTQGEERHFVARLWATRRIGDIIDQIQLYGQSKELVDEIVALSTKFGIITEYTAFLVRDDVDVKDHSGNAKRASDELKGVSTDTGAYGVSKSGDKKDCQEANQARDKNTWRNEKGELVEAKGCVALGKTTLYMKKGQFVDLAAGKPEAEIKFYSDEFFKLLDECPELGRVIALNCDATVKAGAKSVSLKK